MRSHFSAPRSHFRPGDKQAPASAETGRGEGPPDPLEPAGARVDRVARGACAGWPRGPGEARSGASLGFQGLGSCV